MGITVFDRCPICGAQLGREPVVETRQGSIAGTDGDFRFRPYPSVPPKAYHLACFIVQTAGPGNIDGIARALFSSENSRETP